VNVPAAKPCLWPACGQYATPGSSYCREHKNRRRELGLTGGRSYGRDWRRLRAQVLRRQHGRCAICGGLAVQVHHVNGSHDSRPESLLALCPICHASAHDKAWHG
jgi:5-methylcytosine-specific restriction endonuclease McrA